MLNKKIIARILVCTITMINIGNVGNIFASEKSSNFTKEFLEASDDTIVCYMEGMPITNKYSILFYSFKWSEICEWNSGKNYKFTI